jgi:hypothetical protein
MSRQSPSWIFRPGEPDGKVGHVGISVGASVQHPPFLYQWDTYRHFYPDGLSCFTVSSRLAESCRVEFDDAAVATYCSSIVLPCSCLTLTKRQKPDDGSTR